MDRKSFIKKSSAAGLGLSVMPFSFAGDNDDALEKSKERPVANPRVQKKIIVAGAGIAGLCCGYELMKAGHEVVIMDASGRHGGHVLTGRDGLSDGLYVDYGAEGFTNPGYEKFREYIEEFDLDILPYRHRINRLTRVNDQYYTDDELTARRFDQAKELGGFNERETAWLSSNPLWSLETLYLDPYFERFNNDYQPFGLGLGHLDHIPASELFKQEGASDAAINYLGGGNISALYKIWQSYIMKARNIPLHHPEHLYRLKGGNQVMTNAFARRLGERVQLGCRIQEIEHGDSGVTVTYQEFGETKKMSADFLASCLPVPALRNIRVTPDWPSEKRFVLNNLTYSSYPRFAFQARSKFWLKEDISINIQFSHPNLSSIWQVAEEVDTNRAVLMATGSGGVSPQRALQTFKELYPGDPSNIDIEQALVHDWTTDNFAPSCERLAFPIGTLSDFWPHVMTPYGRIHFAGAYADNNNWGMEAATNSANRVAAEIEQS
ncbi:MAG: FAD-dependent oxidoreductase [Balneolaceae bacterium]